MAVDQQRRGAGNRRAFSPDHGLPVSLDEGRDRAAQPPKISEQPLSGLPTVGGVVGERADAGDGQELGQFAEQEIVRAGKGMVWHGRGNY
jgi:hypothetical protein